MNDAFPCWARRLSKYAASIRSASWLVRAGVGSRGGWCIITTVCCGVRNAFLGISICSKPPLPPQIRGEASSTRAPLATTNSAPEALISRNVLRADRTSSLSGALGTNCASDMTANFQPLARPATSSRGSTAGGTRAWMSPKVHCGASAQSATSSSPTPAVTAGCVSLPCALAVIGWRRATAAWAAGGSALTTLAHEFDHNGRAVVMSE